MTKLCVSILLGFLLVGSRFTAASAQPPPESSTGLCFCARPASDCKVCFITNAGAYFPLGNQTAGTPGRRGVVDWGLLVNAGRRNAVGVSWFVTLDDEDELTTGPVARYRRWFQRGGSLDASVGVSLMGSEEHFTPGSLLTAVKYNPVHWFGVALRPEYTLRKTEDFFQVMTPEDLGYDRTEETATSWRVYGGIEIGWYPGLALSVGGAAVLGLYYLPLSSVGWE